MTNANCGSCFYWLRTQDKTGLCRRFPPETLMLGTQQIAGQPPAALTQSAFPPMTEDGWCGEFRERMSVVN